MSDHIHKVRRLRAGSLHRYECLDCGKLLRILSGVIVASTPAEVDAYYEHKRQQAKEKFTQELEQEAQVSETFEAVRQQRDAAVQWIRIIAEELVNAGFPAGDRTVQLKNLRDLLARRTEEKNVLAEWERLFTRFLAIGKFHAIVDELLERTRSVLGG